MDYLHYLADVLIVQSMIRRWFALRKVTTILVCKSIVLQRLARGYVARVGYKKTKAAIKIQKTWRGFVCFADYMFRVADIVIVQTVARRWFACKKANYLRNKIEHDAATVVQRWRRAILSRREQAAIRIQKVWRGLVQEADFVVALYEYRAARTIQTYWRRFWKFSNYLICLDCSIRIQAVVRGFLARCKYADEQWGAVILQAAARGIIGRRRSISRQMLEAQTLTSSAIGSLQSRAAAVIQSSVRGYFGRGAHKKYIAARLIQANFRGYLDRVVCMQHELARVIQRMWRQFSAGRRHVQSQAAIMIQKELRRTIFVSAYRRFLAARSMQNSWRIVCARKMLVSRKAQYIAATAIQSAWRGYFNYTNYLFALCDIVKAQSSIRRRLAEKKLLELRRQKIKLATVAIQKTWRGFYSYTCFLITLSEIIRIQSLFRGFLARRRQQTHYAIVIQKAWRGFGCYTNYKYILECAVMIQSAGRVSAAKRELKKLASAKQKKSAVRLQRTWRCYFCRSNYSFMISDIIKVQSVARRFLAQKIFVDLWEEHAIYSARLLQAKWRSYFARSNFVFVREDIIKIQTACRGFLGRKKFLVLFEEKCRCTATDLQKCWRRHRDQKMYQRTISRICSLQRTTRNFLAIKEEERHAAILLQKVWRGFLSFSAYCITCCDIVTVQSLARGFFARKQYRRLCEERDNRAATRLQASFRGWSAYADFARTKSAALDIQRYWRGFTGRVGLFIAWKQRVYKIHHSVTQVQKVWRGYITMQRYLYKLGSVIEIQSLARFVLVKARCRRMHDAATKIQSLRRKILARRVMLQIFSQMSYERSTLYAGSLSSIVTTIQRSWRGLLKYRLQNNRAFVVQSFMRRAASNNKLRKRIAAKKISAFVLSKYNNRPSPAELQARRRLRAGRIILRFLRTIKAEVDREIELEMKRRKQRKVLRKRSQKKDDAILETAWEKTSRNGLDAYRRRVGASDCSGDRLLRETLNEIHSRTRCTMYAGSPRYHQGAPPMLALADELDDQSCAQSSIGVAIPQAFNKPSTPRIESFSQKEIDDDFCLEEAFLDAEIHSAKSRRQNEKRRSKSSTSRHHRHSKSSNASVTSRASVSSRVSVSSRKSTETRESRDIRNSRASRESGVSDSESKRGMHQQHPQQHRSDGRRSSSMYTP